MMLILMNAWAEPVTALAPYADAREIAEGPDYVRLREIALKILRQYPPDRYIYVGLGRSPTAIVAMLRILTGNAHNLPMTNIGHIQGETVDLKPHLDLYLPETRGRDILLIDYVRTGESLRNGAEVLRQHLGGKAKVVEFALFDIETFEIAPRFDGVTLRRPFNERFMRRHFTPFSEFGPYYTNELKPAAPEDRREQFEELMKSLRERMKSDSELAPHRCARGLTKESA